MKEASEQRVKEYITERHKVVNVLNLGKELDDLEDLYNRTEDPEKKAQIKAKMDEICNKIVTMCAEIKEARLIKKKKERSADSSPEVSEEDTVRRPVEDLSKVICFDIETTGTNRYVDEILQISIIDGNGAVLFNEYVKPKNHDTWDGAQKIHGISPEKVKDCPHIDAYIPRLNEIFAGARLLVGYNIDFDRGFLIEDGVRMGSDCQWFDVMKKFAPVFGKRNGRTRGFKYQKLETCAAFYGYESNGNFHDSLEDTRATLYCYLKMTR